MTSLPACVITVSDRSFAGEREDRGGPIAVGLLRDAGWHCPDAEIVADGVESVAEALRRAVGRGIRLIVTTGGTGVSPRDQTPEGTRQVITREVPGIAEELRRSGLADTPLSVISRGLAGIVDPAGALIVNLPGSTRAVASGIPVILTVARHVVDQVDGGDHS
ncbi:MogA/MoaB family molybdenum cofactor biosynthesis protein [Microbacterium sp. GCS4]|uniref:MogA/MoaB family molybdenum cofactor biosynthesis protein n=1 Tax=Microbacterium sp. GCS4 TaxID=1692239 RepID=UPI0006813312|nr:MogA/MoaB family molybdenum cofactor biosynthesis protein [Microbacterium sp. GCS4]KNY05304.1 molybdenum cofactor synthesis protein [Microbacterium sp. GCS4]